MQRREQKRIIPLRRRTAISMALAASLSSGRNGSRLGLGVVNAQDMLELRADDDDITTVIMQPSSTVMESIISEHSSSTGEPTTMSTSEPTIALMTNTPTTKPKSKRPTSIPTFVPTTIKPSTAAPTMPLFAVACLTRQQCFERYESLNEDGQITGRFYAASDYPVKGCFRKGQNVYWGIGGTTVEITELMPSTRMIRVVCYEQSSNSPSVSTAPSFAPSKTGKPSFMPSMSAAPSSTPSTSSFPTLMPSWDLGRVLQQLDTSYNSDRSSAGIMFDVQAKNPVMIRALSFNTPITNDEVHIEVWTKENSHVGYESNSMYWTLLVNDTVIGKGLDQPTFIPPEIFMPISIMVSEVRAFYIACIDGPCLRYILVDKDADNEEDYHSNDDMRLYRDGTAKSLGFDGSIYVPRTFSGSVHYDIITSSPTNSPTEQPTLSPSTSPTMAPVPNEFITTRSFESSAKIIDIDQKFASYDGTMFFIYARENIVINSVSFNTLLTSKMNVTLFTKYGNVTGYDTSLDGWEILASGEVEGQGLGRPTVITEGSFEPLLIRRRHQQAFYIATDGPYLRLSMGTEKTSSARDNDDEHYEPSDYNTDLIVYEGIGKRKGIDGPSFFPRVWNGAFQYGVVEIPTDMPTLSPSGSPTESPSNSPTKFSFRLRLHWQRGYYWQDDWSDEEKYWCMECASETCTEDDNVFIDYCSDKMKQQFSLVGSTLRPAMNKELCMTYIGRSNEELVSAKLVMRGKRHIVLRPCLNDQEGYHEQQFEGFQWDGTFELHSKGRTDQCITQWHHPKAKELLYPEDCRVARDEVTSLWHTY